MLFVRKIFTPVAESAGDCVCDCDRYDCRFYSVLEGDAAEPAGGNPQRIAVKRGASQKEKSFCVL